MEELFHEQHAGVTYQSFDVIAKLQKILRLYIFGYFRSFRLSGRAH